MEDLPKIPLYMSIKWMLVVKIILSVGRNKLHLVKVKLNQEIKYLLKIIIFLFDKMRWIRQKLVTGQKELPG